MLALANFLSCAKVRRIHADEAAMVKISDFDDAYQNGAYIPDADGFITLWTEAAASFRAAYPPVTHYYGTGPRQYFDLFMPDGAPKA